MRVAAAAGGYCANEQDSVSGLLTRDHQHQHCHYNLHQYRHPRPHIVIKITLRVSLSSRPKSSNWREQSPSSFAPDNHDDDHQSTDDDDDDNDDDNYDDDDDDAYEVDYDDELDLAHALSTWHQGGCIGKALGQFLRAPATYSLSLYHHI